MEQNKSIDTDMYGDVFSRLSKLEVKKYKKYIELVKPEADKILEEIIPKGCWTLGVRMKDTNVVAKIVLDSNETHYIGKNIEIDNEYLWSYVVNKKYYDNRKIISLFDTKEMFDPITLGSDIYNQLDELYNDEEYLKLIEELRMFQKVYEIYETLGIPPNQQTPIHAMEDSVKFICTNLDKIRKIFDEKKINNIIERARLVSGIEDGSLQNKLPDVYHKIKDMTIEEFIEYVDSYVTNEKRIYKFNEEPNADEETIARWRKLGLTDGLKGEVNENNSTSV